jgi:PAS domain S-box-containing protein
MTDEFPISTARSPGSSESHQSTSLHVVCSIQAERDRELLVDWLESVDAVTVSTAAPDLLATVPFDLCVIDQPALQAVGDELLDRTQREQPLALPCLLFTTGRPTAKTAAGESTAVPPELQTLVSDVIKPPIRKAQLRRRLSVLLEIRRQSKQLARSNAHHRQLLELLPEAVLVVSQGTIQYANSAAECLFDADDSVLVGDRFLDYIAAESQDRVTELLTTAQQTDDVNQSVAAEFVALDLDVDGESIQIEAAGTAVGLTGDSVQLVCRDMTERNERESQLQLYRMAMDEATVGITITDARQEDNPLVYVNQQFEQLTGLDREWMIGQNPRFAQSPRTDPETVAAIREAVDAGESISVEVINQSADGTEWYNALTISPVHQDGELTHFLGFQRNITATRAQQNQLAVLDRVLRHNLRNRLNVVLGHAETLKKAASIDTVPLHAGTICDTAQDLLSLSDKTRRFRSALETDAETTAQISLASLVEDCLTEIETQNPDAVFDAQLPETVQVQFHGAIRFAVIELLANAVDHSTQKTPHVAVCIEETDTDVCVRITDNGPGIPTDEQLAFEDTTETPTDHAIGIGLWLVRWAVDSAGGELDYEQADPHGSIVTVRLPLATRPRPDYTSSESTNGDTDRTLSRRTETDAVDEPDEST